MLIRYPGSKDRHLKFILPFMLQNINAGSTISMIEPFAGTASITFALLNVQKLSHYTINDIDEGISTLWNVVKYNPDKLIHMVKQYIPSTEDFYNYKQSPLVEDQVETAFRKIVLHQISYSGLGLKAGSPIGGKNQDGKKYTVNCRWNPDKISSKISKCSYLLNSVPGSIINSSWEIAMEDTNVFYYLDPPYYEAGKALYKNGEIDHDKLSISLSRFSSWILSYDDCEYIRNLYKWATVEKLDVTSHLHHSKINDLIIFPHPR